MKEQVLARRCAILHDVSRTALHVDDAVAYAPARHDHVGAGLQDNDSCIPRSPVLGNEESPYVFVPHGTRFLSVQEA
mgnify:CR=1 FL=1